MDGDASEVDLTLQHFIVATSDGRKRGGIRAAQAQWAGMTAEERSAWARKLYHARAKAREGNGKANG